MKAAEIVVQIETEMLENLVNLLMGGGSIADAEWQLRKLNQIGILTEKNGATIRKHRQELIEAVRAEIEFKVFERATMIDDATKGSGRSISEVLKPRADPVLLEIIETWERSALAAIDRSQAQLILGANSMYRDAVLKAAAEVQLGVSGRKAIAQVCTEWAENGIPALKDASGRTWTAEAYAQATIRTSATNSATETQFARMEELGEDLVEVSSHLGARPKCEPYQGKIFSLSGKSKNYPWLYDPDNTTWGNTIGQPDGLFGVNCRHVMYPYFPGTEKTFQPQDAERNETAYKNEQKQRYLERSIRKAKLGVYLVSKTGVESEIQAAKDKLASREAAMRALINDTGRKRYGAREQIFTGA